VTRRPALLGLVAVACLVPTGCSDDEPAAGEARLEVDGQAIVERSDGDEEIVEDDTDLRTGDRVELTEGTGRMVLRGGVRMELRPGLGDAADTMVLMGDVPELEAGDLLVNAPGSAELSAAGSTLVIEEGAARVSRALGLGVAAYDGVVHLDSAGVERTIPALREMRVAALGRAPRLPRPLDYGADDPWDRRFLGTWIDLGRTLEALANGYTQNLNPGEGRTPGFFRLVLPGLDDEDEFGAELIDLDRAPGETLIGAAITEMGSKGEFGERWSSVFGFRDDGAEWGLVALDQEVAGTPLLGTIEEAVGASPLTFAAGPAGLVPPGSSSAPADGAPTTPTTTPSSPPPTTPTTQPPAPPPTTPEEPVVPENPITPVLEPVLDPVLDPVADAVDDLFGGLLGP
jgi:hypothetical protein